jgi:6-phosphogluconolactonase
MGEVQLISFKNDDLLAAAVAEAWLSVVAEAQTAGRKHLVALSGGRVTKKFFASAAQQAQSRKISFRDVEFFWADERCVPPDDPESNFLLADENLFKPAQVSPKSIHRILGERDVATAARLAAEELSFIADERLNSIPFLNLILLGMGEDGHVASLFPGDVATAQDRESIFLAVENSPKPPPKRVTLGHGPIAEAHEVWVLASGKGKEAALRESLSSNGNTPLARVIQSRAMTQIFSDISRS